MNKGSAHIIFVLALLLAGSACNNIKYLKPGEELYTGARVHVESKDNVNKKEIKKAMEAVLRPRPNQTIAGIRFKLWLYNIAGPSPKKGFKKWLKNKVGEPPVIFDMQTPGNVSEIMVNRLNNLGYFDASSRHKSQSSKSKVTVDYTVTVTKPYTIDSVSFPKPVDEVNGKIYASQEETLIKPGMQYDLDLLKAERARIDYYLKNEGFYYFNPDYLLFKADSSTGKKTVKLKILLKSDVPEKAKARYVLNNIYINPSYRLKDSSRKVIVDTIKIDGFYYLNKDSMFHPEAVTRAIFLKKGEHYSRKAYSLTISRLTGMNVFRYVNIRFVDTIVDGYGRLDAYINMTPMQRRSLQLELQAVTKSNNYTGPALTASYKNRNLFHGAELLVVNLNTSYETQFTGIQKGFNSYEVGVNTQLYLPKFVTPFPIKNVSGIYVPRTKIDLGFRNLNRVLYFNMNAANFSYGYTWKESARKEHELNPIALNFARLMNTTEAFDELLASNPFLRKSFEEQFTIGGNYSFTYNALINNPRRHQLYFNGLLDVSGNLLNFTQTLITGHKPTDVDPHLLFGYRYSQYSKVSTDTRYHFIINRNSKIATRVLAGIGIPYGNSTNLPYIKQFFSGGSNSIRAFLPRTVGPGTYKKPDSLFTRTFLDQAGDVKLEGNIEYRFTIISVLKGALFMDAGNIWLFKKSEQLPGGEFNVNQFYKQLAVGSGFGFRIDITYFVLRFDLGIPLRKPYIQENNGWVLKQINVGNGTWRSQNIVLNIAIGYPF